MDEAGILVLKQAISEFVKSESEGNTHDAAFMFADEDKRGIVMGICGSKYKLLEMHASFIEYLLTQGGCKIEELRLLQDTVWQSCTRRNAK